MADYCPMCGNSREDSAIADVSFGDIRISAIQRHIYCGSRNARVSPQDIRVMNMLVKRKIVSTEALMMQLTKDGASLGSIYTTVTRLRSLFARLQSRVRLVNTYGFYQLEMEEEDD